jgi:Mg2+ and Co2+ transporter CorA
MSEIDRHSSVSDDGPTVGDKGSADDPWRRSKAEARRRAGGAAEHFRVRRFDADRTDEELTFDEAISSKPGRRQLLWIDIASDLSSSEAETLAGRFKLDPRTRRALQTAGERPHLALSVATSTSGWRPNPSMRFPLRQSGSTSSRAETS